VRVAVEEPGAGSRDEERLLAWARAELVTAKRVGSQRLDGAWVQRDFSGLAELGLPDLQPAGGQLDVVAVQPQGLTDAQPRHR
jgi:hypothetical protein